MNFRIDAFISALKNGGSLPLTVAPHSLEPLDTLDVCSPPPESLDCGKPGRDFKVKNGSSAGLEAPMPSGPGVQGVESRAEKKCFRGASIPPRCLPGEVDVDLFTQPLEFHRIEPFAHGRPTPNSQPHGLGPAMLTPHPQCSLDEPRMVHLANCLPEMLRHEPGAWRV